MHVLVPIALTALAGVLAAVTAAAVRKVEKLRPIPVPVRRRER